MPVARLSIRRRAREVNVVRFPVELRDLFGLPNNRFVGGSPPTTGVFAGHSLSNRIPLAWETTKTILLFRIWDAGLYFGFAD